MIELQGRGVSGNGFVSWSAGRERKGDINNSALFFLALLVMLLEGSTRWIQSFASRRSKPVSVLVGTSHLPGRCQATQHREELKLKKFFKV